MRFSFLSAIFFGRKQPAMAPSVATASDVAANRGSAFLRLAATHGFMAPREASVGAFVAWLQELGEAGDWEQHELLGEYETICDLTGVEPMPGKWFGKALERHGCTRREAKLWVDGKRYRPIMVSVPAVATKPADVVPTEATHGQTNVVPLGNKRPQTRAVNQKVSRSGSQAKARRLSGGGKARAYRADIAEAVACNL